MAETTQAIEKQDKRQGKRATKPPRQRASLETLEIFAESTPPVDKKEPKAVEDEAKKVAEDKAEKAESKRKKELAKAEAKAKKLEKKQREAAEKTAKTEVQASANKNGDARMKYEEMLRAEEAVSYFEAIVSGLREGAIQFKQGDKSLNLSPPSDLRVEVKARRKGRKEKVSFEISWRCDDPAKPQTSSAQPSSGQPSSQDAATQA